jgi:pRiA4b ORF-3-like protein/SEC-C motif-containing protein
MKLYRVRVVPEHAPEVWRLFEFSARHTLGDVHLAIQQAFELANDHLYTFFMSGQRWDKASQIDGPEGLTGMGRADRVRLFELRLEPRKRFRYLFDFGDELWHLLEVESVSESDAPPAAPRLIEAMGDAPPQYPGLGDPSQGEDEDESEAPDVSALLPLANELMALLAPDAGAPGGFAPEDLDPEDLDLENLDLEDDAHQLGPETLRSAHGVVLKLLAELESDEERLWALDEACDYLLVDLLFALPFDLARVSMVDEGADLALALAFAGRGHFWGARAIILAHAGRREEALAQLTQNLQSMPSDVWVEIKAAEAYASLGELTRAEASFRSALERSEEDDERDSALEGLLSLLSDQGRPEEAEAVLRAEQARVALTQSYTAEGLRRLAPKVGRNDPCPCGSGKKYKKCCGA